MNTLDGRSKDLRKNVVRLVEGDRRGHIGPALSLIEIMRVLFDSYLTYDSSNPKWEKRDRFILSKGHGCLALYSILADKKFFSKDEFNSFCKPTSILGGHPERGKTPGVEASTGSLGHGMPIAVGMAIAAKIKVESHRVVVVMGDGEVNEGSVWEAALSASKHKLSNLLVIIDHNRLQSYGKTSEVLELSPLPEKWRSFGFSVHEIDGHDVSGLEVLLNIIPVNSVKPTVIICHTIKGKGFYFAEGDPSWHHKSDLNEQDILSMYKCLE